MTERELDANEEIGGTDDMGGFELPPPGNISEGTGQLMEFTGEITDCGEDKTSLGFELEWAEDPSRKAWIYCKTTTQAGLTRIVGLGTNSGVFDKIDKKRKKANKKAIRSDEGKVVVKILKDPKFHAQLRQEIAGCQILCSITHSPAKAYKDKETGEEKEGFPKANITKIAAPGKAAKKAAAPDASASGGGTSDKEDDWD